MPVASIELLAGILQGCPLSRTIFALALEPFVRWYLARPVFNATQISLFADDSANAFRDVYRRLPLVLRALHWSLASGLTLRFAKCVVLPCWEGDYTELVAFVSSLPGLTAGAVRTSARYLGALSRRRCRRALGRHPVEHGHPEAY